MSGTRAGGLKATAKCKENYGDDFYKRIGAKGGKLGHTGGFAENHQRAVEAGRKGGAKSTRKGVKNGEGKKRTYIRAWGE